MTSLLFLPSTPEMSVFSSPQSEAILLPPFVAAARYLRSAHSPSDGRPGNWPASPTPGDPLQNVRQCPPKVGSHHLLQALGSRRGVLPDIGTLKGYDLSRTGMKDRGLK